LARTPGDTAGFLTGLAMLALVLVSMPAGMRRRLIASFAGGTEPSPRSLCFLLFKQHLRAGIPIAQEITEETEKRFRMPAGRVPRLYAPSLFWRFVTYILVVCLLGTDPRLDFFTLHAQCANPWNPSTPTTRITQFSYDFDGHVTQMNAPEGAINHAYDLPTGRLTAVCTINSQTARYAVEADFVGLTSGRDTDKFPATGLTPVKSDRVDAPYVEEFPLVLECKVLETLDLGTHVQFIGEILNVLADESVLGATDEPLIEKVAPFILNPGDHSYHAIGHTIGPAFSIGLELLKGKEPNPLDAGARI